MQLSPLHMQPFISTGYPLKHHFIGLTPLTPSLCTDNAAMIAGAAYEKVRLGKTGPEPGDVNPNLRLADWE